MEIPTNSQACHSFDKSYTQKLAVARPESYKQLFRFLDAPDQKLIARGAGLSYAPASFVEDGVSVSSELFNRVLCFDKDKGVVCCEPGIRLYDLLSVVNANGWTLSVLPGYPSISVGGCIAFNIHGKSQFHTGNFSDCIKSLKLYHPSHGELDCNHSENVSTYELTIGGMGLTGFITEVELQLSPLNYRSIALSKKKVNNIYEGIEFLTNEAENYKAVYSWHNFMSTGSSFGNGIVYCEQNSDKVVKAKPYNGFKTSASKPLPLNLLNYFTTGMMNRVYQLKDRLGGTDNLVDIAAGSFPIYGKEIYYALFGKQGFLEYQFIASFDKIKPLLKEIEQWVRTNKQPVSLASLKLFKGDQSLLNFCGTGVCLALDVPNNKKAHSFFDFLDDLCTSSSSIMNIAKDSRLTQRTVEAVYPEYGKFKDRLLAFDGKKIFSSEVRNRLEL